MPSSTTSSPVTDPGVPTKAKALSGDGAVAFTTYFLSQANIAYAHLKPEAIEALSAPTCKSCAAMAGAVRGYMAQKHHYVGDFVTPTFVTISTFKGQEAKVFVSTDTKPAKVVDDAGTTVEELPAEQGNSSVFLEYRNGSWRISEVKVVA